MQSLVLIFANKARYSILPPGVKQTIFSYLPIADLVKTINKLSHAERALLNDQSIVREKKMFVYKVPRPT